MRELEARVRSVELFLTLMQREQSNVQTQKDSEDLAEESESNSELSNEPSMVSHRVQLNLRYTDNSQDLGLGPHATPTGWEYPYDKWSQTWDRGLAVTERYPKAEK